MAIQCDIDQDETVAKDSNMFPVGTVQKTDGSATGFIGDPSVFRSSRSISAQNDQVHYPKFDNLYAERGMPRGLGVQ